MQLNSFSYFFFIFHNSLSAFVKNHNSYLAGQRAEKATISWRKTETCGGHWRYVFWLFFYFIMNCNEAKQVDNILKNSVELCRVVISLTLLDKGSW